MHTVVMQTYTQNTLRHVVKHSNKAHTRVIVNFIQWIGLICDSRSLPVLDNLLCAVIHDVVIKSYAVLIIPKPIIYLLLPVNDCPDDKYLNKYVRGKVCAAGANKWRDLGIVLMGQDAVTVLDVIRINHPNDVEECCSRMFTKWRQRTPKTSWKQLIGALKEVKLTQLASELEEGLHFKGIIV